MDNKDDILLEQFLAPARKEIADNGFTEKVIRRLPEQEFLYSPATDFLVKLLVAILFVVSGGLTALADNLQQAIAYANHNVGSIMHFDITYAPVVALAIYAFCSYCYKITQEE